MNQRTATWNGLPPLPTSMILLVALFLPPGCGACQCQPEPLCEETPCLRANECVQTCGGPVRYFGCCPCTGGTFDRVSECSTDSGPGFDSQAPPTDSFVTVDATVNDSGLFDSGLISDDSGPWDSSFPTDSALPTDANLFALGHGCSASWQCLSGLCQELIFGTGEIRCTALCNVGMPACPENGICYVPGAAAGNCVPRCDPALMDCPMGLSCIGTGFMSPDDFACYP